MIIPPESSEFWNAARVLSRVYACMHVRARSALGRSNLGFAAFVRMIRYDPRGHSYYPET